MDIIRTDSSREESLKPGTARVPASRLTDGDLERGLSGLVAAECEATADIVDHIAEFERRRLFAPRSFPSMFEYCTKRLGYSEGAAYLRIYAGRLSLEYPEILDLLRTRKVHLTAIRTVGPHLKPGNSRDLLARASLKSERELKFMIAEGSPRPEPRELIRRLPAPEPPSAAITPMAPPKHPSETASDAPSPEPERQSAPPEPERSPAPPEPENPPVSPQPCAAPVEPSPTRPQSSAKDRVEPLSKDRVRFAFTGTREFLGRFERARQLLWHQYPAGALEDVFRESLDALLDARDPARKKRAVRPRATNPRARSIPRWVKDVVFKRDNGRCAFLSAAGIRCEERGGLEYDHVVPWAKGGPSNDPANIRLLCRTHNMHEAARVFGPEIMSRRGA